MLNLTNKSIVVTGGNGFLGSHLVPLLQEKCRNVFVVEHKEYDLLSTDNIKRLYRNTKPNIIIHLAARVGGIQYNQANPAKLFYENLKMGVALIHQAHKYNGIWYKLDKFVCLGTTCIYPKVPPHIPFVETDIWEGYPESTNAPYGIAKKSLLVMCQAYRQQYEMNCIYLIPINLYGEEDEFNDEQAHVIPMLIKKFLVAKEQNLPEVEVWGSGKATREFMYAGDAAKLIIKATEIYDKPEPLNIGVSKETSINELLFIISEIIGYKGKIVWDKTKPDGQPRRILDITNMLNELQYKDKFVSLEEGLKRTIEWYKKNKQP